MIDPLISKCNINVRCYNFVRVSCGGKGQLMAVHGICSQVSVYPTPNGELASVALV